MQFYLFPCRLYLFVRKKSCQSLSHFQKIRNPPNSISKGSITLTTQSKCYNYK